MIACVNSALLSLTCCRCWGLSDKYKHLYVKNQYLNDGRKFPQTKLFAWFHPLGPNQEFSSNIVKFPGLNQH